MWLQREGRVCSIIFSPLFLRASSYEPGNRAGSVTGTNSVVCSYGKFQPGQPGWIQETQPNWWNINLRCILFATVRTLWTLVTLLIKLLRIPFWPLSGESEAILSKMFRPGHRAGVFIWENFHPGYRDLGRKNRDLGNRASPASHMNTSIFLQRKEWRGEISETEPARLTGLIWRGPKMPKGKCSTFWHFNSIMRLATRVIFSAQDSFEESHWTGMTFAQ